MRLFAGLLLAAACTAPNPEYRLHAGSPAGPRRPVSDGAATGRSPDDLLPEAGPGVDAAQLDGPVVVAPPDDLGSADGPPTVAVGPACDPVSQTGCLAGQKCGIVSHAAVCLPDGTKPAGAVCTSGAADDCVHGTSCSNGNCRPFCATSSECTQPAVGDNPDNHARCSFSGTFGLCTIACNPVAAAGASGCATGQNCGLAAIQAPDGSLVMVTDCFRTGNVAEGEACLNLPVCAAGLSCYDGHCRASCRTGVDADCSDGLLCTDDGTLDPLFQSCCPVTGC